MRKLQASMSHVLQTAPTGRSRCHACGRSIARGAWQLVEHAPSAYSSLGTPVRFHVDCAVLARPAQLREALQAHAGAFEGREALLAQLEQVLQTQPPRELPYAERREEAMPCAACGEPIAPGALSIAQDGDGPPHLHLSCAADAGLTELDEALIRTHSRGLDPRDLALVAGALLGGQ